ncbi:hypothetical protein G6045_31605 [Streptomyces sp. YC504]|uniref:Uncharacterized protein n=1 Tax=Streptomyces mesophilus TaxID=1775132 RepID=A0A6G4XTR6_9ACTN|nr:hypothetical protein [Streptomyces mesophilus]NGO80170.1 hypothetical protein [Streptomyces mesophilus]
MPNSSYLCARGLLPGLTERWFETADGGQVLRQVTRAPTGAVSSAWARREADLMRERFGSFGVALYEAVYGAPAEPPGTPGPAGASGTPSATLSAEEFEDAWWRGRIGRHFTPYDSGPVPQGTRLTGTVDALPWGPGVTGLTVDLGLPVGGFVDMGALPGDPDLWPAVGARGDFEVITLRIDCEGGAHAQIRLRPAAD